MDNLEEMDKFLETYSLPKLSQEETCNLNRPITRSEIESVVKTKQNNKQTKKLPANKSSGPYSFTGESYETYKEEIIPILPKLFQKLKQREHYHSHSMQPPALTLIPKPYKDTTKKENYRPISLAGIN